MVSKKLDKILEDAARLAEDNPDADSLDDIPLSKTDEIGRFFASLEFAPRPSRHSDSLEYARTYNDDKGRVGRVVAVVKKDQIGLEPELLNYFVVSVQIHVPATPEAIEKRAPGFCREHLMKCLGAFAGAEGPTSAASRFVCESCKQGAEDYVVMKGKKLCLACHRKQS